MQPSPVQDVELLQSFIDDDIPLPVLLRWIDPRDHGCPPSDLLSDPTAENLPWTPENSTCVEETHLWKDKLDSTSRQSFALSFLHYLRTQLQPLFAVADCSTASAQHKTATKEDRGRTSSGLGNECLHQRTQRPVSALPAPHLTKGSQATLALEPRLDRQEENGTAQVYESEFPALAPLSAQSNAPKAKQRRRVTPTPTAEIVVDTAFVLANLELSNVKQRNGKRFQPRNLEVDLDTLMQRSEANRKQKQEKNAVKKKDVITLTQLECAQRWGCAESESALPGPTGNSVTFAADKDTAESWKVLSQQSSSTSSLPCIQLQGSGPQHPRTSDCDIPLPRRLLRVSTVHATLMVARMVPSLLGELQFLLQLLTLPTISCNKADAGEACLFRDSDDCSRYACLVLHQAGRLLECVGEYLLSALVDEPAVARHSPQLLARIKAALADQQGASLRSVKAYETAATVDALQTSPSPSMQSYTVPHLLVSGPFQAARDSRHNFKTPEEIKVYNNREQCRDLFYSIIREAAAAYSAFGSGAHESEQEGFHKMKENANQFLEVLLTDNYPWFAEFFLEQVLQVYFCGNPDPLVAGLARQDQVKLQKLHDRLSGTTAGGLSTRHHKRGTLCDGRLDLSPSSPWSQVNNTHSEGTANKSRNTSSRGLHFANRALGARGHPDTQEVFHSRFSRLFPQFLQVYIWFLEATDSHRLNTHLIWSIKYKIASLTEVSPGDLANFGSGFTQRVLALKAIAGLLGFFSFSPGVGRVPSAPVVGAASEGWPVFRGELPIDVEGVLHMAKTKGLVLLVLPWVVEFLRLSKADGQACYQPYLYSSLSALRNLYLLPILDPFHQDFGVGSICILAELDSFFEYMELPVNADNTVSQDEPAFPCSRSRTAPAHQNVAEVFIGLDKVPGIVDSRYIVHCCHTLVEMRLELLEGKRRNQRVMFGRSPGPGRPLRKITPVQNGCDWQLPSPSPRFLGKKNTSSTNKPETLKLHLQRNFLEQRPPLRMLVDFLVDIVAVNAASAAVSKFVPQVIVNAFGELDREPDFDTPSCLEMTAEQIVSSAIRKVLPAASGFLRVYTAERTSQALSILVCPNEITTVVGVAAGIAAEAAGLSAEQKALARISTEIRKQVTEAVQSQRGQLACTRTRSKLCPLHIGSFAQHMTQQGPLLDNRVSNVIQRTVATEVPKPSSPVLQTGQDITSVSPQHITTEAARQGNMLPLAGILEKSTKFMGTVKRQLAFSGRTCQPADYRARRAEREVVLAGKIVQACSQARQIIASGLCTDEGRNLVRQQLSIMCLSIEALLSQVGGIPSGGADRLVVERYGLTLLRKLSGMTDAGVQQIHDFSTSGDSSRNHLRVELGIIRRSVALALRLCFLSPRLALGLKVGNQIPQCLCDSIDDNFATVQTVCNIPLELVHIEECGRQLFPSCALNQNHLPQQQWCGPTTTSASGKGFSGCQQALWFEKHLAGPMLELVSVWKVLVKQEICSVTFLIGELMAPWRWDQAIQDSWRTGKSWIKTPKNGLIGALLRIIRGSSVVEDG